MGWSIHSPKARQYSPAATAPRHVQAGVPAPPPAVTAPPMQHHMTYISGTIDGEENAAIMQDQIRAMLPDVMTIDNRESIDTRRLQGRMR